MQRTAPREQSGRRDEQQRSRRQHCLPRDCGLHGLLPIAEEDELVAHQRRQPHDRDDTDDCGAKDHRIECAATERVHRCNIAALQRPSKRTPPRP